jgi:transcription initiation factor IIF auxiliary subunit
MEGFPMRTWSIEIYLINDQGQEVVANCFDKAVYNLHPSFERPKQSEAPLLLL